MPIQFTTKFTDLLELGEDVSAVPHPLKNKDLPSVTTYEQKGS